MPSSGASPAWRRSSLRISRTSGDRATMSMSLIAPAVDHRPAPELVREPPASLDQHDLSIDREPPESTPAIVEGGDSVARRHRRTAVTPPP